MKVNRTWDRPQTDRTIIRMECVDSTNEEAKRGGDCGAAHGTVYCAKRQSAGKGRRGRSWLSESSENLYFTILLRPQLAPEKITMLTLVMAYAVAEAITECTGLETGIKWPNDIVVGTKKVCGILSEMKLEGVKAAYCVIGVGINIGQTVFPQELQDKATSLQAELAARLEDQTGIGLVNQERTGTEKACLEFGKKSSNIQAEELLQVILQQFDKAYEGFLEAEGLDPLLEQYNERLANRGKRVRVLEPTGEYEGIALGITPLGELLVEKDDKAVQKVYAGEVSVRGLYGYI